MTAKNETTPICEPFFSKGRWRVVFIFVVPLLILLIVRSLFLTQVVVVSAREDLGLLPGDRILVNRTSFGMRLPFEYWWGYHRLNPSEPEKGDLVVFEHPDGSGRYCLDRVEGLPGDTLWFANESDTFMVVPQGTYGVNHSVFSQHSLIGRPICISYSVDASQPFYKMLRSDRLFSSLE